MSGIMGNKYRHEYKYRIDAGQAAILEMRASMLLQADSHAGESGTYLIKSLYFDDYNERCFKENEDGADNRSKFRIRYYNDDLSCIRLEKKSKRNGMTLKESCLITEAMCREFMAGRIPQITDDMSQKMKSLFTEMRLKCMTPKIIVIYERKPYVCSIGNVRVTFDRCISAANVISDFLKSELTVRPIMAKGESILEVKWDELLPDYISDQLSLESLQWSSFSKYYLCRKYDCYGGVNI